MHLDQLGADGVLHEPDVTAALLRACRRHIGVDGLTGSEARGAIANGLAYGRRRPRDLPSDPDRVLPTA